MSISRTAKFTLAAVLGLGIAATAIPAKATGHFDGKWSVVVVTTKGDCDRAYRYGITIENGDVVYDGGVVSLSGRVAGSGAVRVIVKSGNARANATGRLNRRAGSGGWHGNSGQNVCSGYWQASRN